MAAKDYTFAEGMIDIYLVKRKKRDDGKPLFKMVLLNKGRR